MPATRIPKGSGSRSARSSGPGRAANGQFTKAGGGKARKSAARTPRPRST